MQSGLKGAGGVSSSKVLQRSAKEVEGVPRLKSKRCAASRFDVLEGHLGQMGDHLRDFPCGGHDGQGDLRKVLTKGLCLLGQVFSGVSSNA